MFLRLSSIKKHQFMVNYDEKQLILTNRLDRLKNVFYGVNIAVFPPFGRPKTSFVVIFAECSGYLLNRSICSTDIVYIKVRRNKGRNKGDDKWFVFMNNDSLDVRQFGGLLVCGIRKRGGFSTVKVLMFRALARW